MDLPEALTLARGLLAGSPGLPGVYEALEALATGVRAAYPESLCAAGCSGCCAMSKALVRIFRSEWNLIHDHMLATWPPERLERFVSRFWEDTGPFLPTLEAIQHRLDRGERVRPHEVELPIDCPMLEEGRCSVYDARAAICRGFGYFHLQPGDEGPDEVYACNRQRAALAAHGDGAGPRIRLPLFNPVYARVEDACLYEAKLLIPLWVARTFPPPPAPQ